MKERKKFGPPKNIEPTNSPLEDYSELAMFQARFVTALKNRDVEKLPSFIEKALNDYSMQLEELICWGELLLRQHAERAEKEKFDVMNATQNDEILEVMFKKNLKGTLQPNMFGNKMEQLEKKEKAAYMRLKQQRKPKKNLSTAEKKLIKKL